MKIRQTLLSGSMRTEDRVRNQRGFDRGTDGVDADDGSSVEDGGHQGGEAGRFPRFNRSERDGFGVRSGSGVERRERAAQKRLAAEAREQRTA